MTSCETACERVREANPDCLIAASDEREFVERSATDRTAIGILYRRHYPAIASYIRRRVGCCHDAEDLIAETFMAMVAQLPKYRVRGAPFRSWLYRLATTQVNRWARKRRRAAIRELSARDQELTVERANAGRMVIDRDRVRLALLSLPARYQAILSLHYMEGMSIAEIAQVLNCASGTVKSRLARGREKMRQQIERMRDRDDRSP